MGFVYGSSPNPDLLARIPRDARRVLDVGCGAGATLAAYRRLNPRATLLGVEPDAALAAAAAPALDGLFATDIEAAPPPVEPGTLDAILFGDVLEHLRDPWTVLARMAPLLSEDGVLLACVPNVEHWSFVARLLAGSFDYEPHGLFDRTHLRWFTPRMMHRALAEAGLHPLEVAPRIFAPEQGEAFAAALAPGLEALGIAPAEWLARAQPLQWVWRAARRPPRPLLVAARTLPDPVAAMAEVRVLQPLRDLASLPGVSIQAAPDLDLPAPPPGMEAVPRVLLVQRMYLPDAPAGHEFVARARASGAVLVQEFDDDPDRWPALAESGQFSFRAVHAVQASTPALAAELRQWNPEVAVFPNGVAELPDPVNFQDDAPLTLFFGALNRTADAAPFLQALNQALAEAAGRLRIAVVNDCEVFAALETPHKTYTPGCDYATYRGVMAGCELAFLPLADTRFNRMKSDLKAVEAASHRLCCLASPTVYAESLEDGRTGLIAEDPGHLLALLRAILANPPAARRIAEAARDWVRAERMTAYQARRRLDWYRDLWDRRAALDAALAARIG
ncbi:class I SAM-dependent methyltransferase, partial [Paracraurococcus ruber]